MAVGIGTCGLAAGESCQSFPAPSPSLGCLVLYENTHLGVSFSFEVLNPSLSVSFPLCRVVKEEISDDNAKLPCFNGRVVSWVSKPLASVCLSLKNTV